MIERVLCYIIANHLYDVQAIEKFLSHDEFEELRRYQLNNIEWDTLKAYKKILDVRAHCCITYSDVKTDEFEKVPHAFQQRLSAEKTPTLCDAVPSFESMLRAWQRQKAEWPHLAPVINAGMEKLASYRDRLEDVPAYVLAMSKSYHLVIYLKVSKLTQIVLNPAKKLSYYSRYKPEKVQWAKDLFIREVRDFASQPFPISCFVDSHMLLAAELPPCDRRSICYTKSSTASS